MCLLSLLDEECRFPNGSDASFAAKVRKTHKEDDFFAVPRFSQTGFTVKHYAGIRFPRLAPRFLSLHSVRRSHRPLLGNIRRRDLRDEDRLLGPKQGRARTGASAHSAGFVQSLRQGSAVRQACRPFDGRRWLGFARGTRTPPRRLWLWQGYAS